MKVYLILPEERVNTVRVIRLTHNREIGNWRRGLSESIEADRIDILCVETAVTPVAVSCGDIRPLGEVPVVISEQQRVSHIQRTHVSHNLSLIDVRSAMMVEIESLSGHFIGSGIEIDAFRHQVFLAGTPHQERVTE